jgi:hypothetical protein
MAGLLIPYLGTPGEGPGTGDVFQYLATLVAEYGADPGAGGGSMADILHALRYIYDAIGATGQAQSPSGTALQRLLNIITELGQTGDAASSGGSALARLAYLINQLAAGVTIGRTAHWGSFSTAASSLQNALSVSGKGTLEHLSFVVPASTASWELKITLDGGVLSDITFLPSLGVYHFPSGDFVDDSNFASAKGWVNAGANSATVINLSADFQTSLLIQLKGDATRAPSVFWHYNK